jgi:hypothetical protein
MPACSKCGKTLNDGDKYCTGCGVPIVMEAVPLTRTQVPSVASTVRRTFSRKAKLIYSLVALAFLGIFTSVFLSELPGKANPIIAGQPDIAMAATFIGVNLKAQPIDVRIRNGKVSFPLPVLLEKKMVQFDYPTGSTSLPLMAFISPEGKLVTAVRLCEPCNSHSFVIESDEMVCGTCGTRWKLRNLEGVQGSCQKYPPDPIPSEIVGNEIQIDEQVLKNWKMRI